MPELTLSVDLFVLLLILVLGLIFDFINGFHDTANAIATVVATRVLSPGRAVLMAGVLNFVGALSGTAVATTVGKGIIPPELSTQALRSEERRVGKESRPRVSTAESSDK